MGSRDIELAPKAFSLLKFLAVRPGQLISKDELLDAIWPDVSVGEAVLKVAVAEIRKALADESKRPRFIETAHRRGYRFIGRTEVITPSSQDELRPNRIEPEPDLGTPETHYARSGDVSIAYQVIGEGPPDLIFVMGWVSHLEYFWTEPSFARFLRHLASFSRVVLFDKRGTGLSDRVPISALPSLEQRMEDLEAVMQAAQVERAALCGVSEGGTMAALFAATHPQRTTALLMIGAYAKRIRDATYPWGPTEKQRETFLDEIRDQWGGPVGLEERAPSVANDSHFRNWWATYLRMSASPSAAVAFTRMNSQVDIREILPSIRVPTLVLHRTGDRCLLVEEARYVASRIPNARLVELPGVDHLPFVGDQESILNEIEEFLTGARHVLEPERVLATVLSITINPDNQAWRRNQQLVQRAEEQVKRELAWFKGRECRASEEGLLAAFDGPVRAIRCACAIASHLSRFGVTVRAGLHTGECFETGEGICGLAVEMSRLIELQGQPGEIWVSGTVRDLSAGSEIHFCEPAGTVGAMPIFMVGRVVPQACS